ncbi:hypothetical protein ACYOEI_06185 [Singulisphaera rosea]
MTLRPSYEEWQAHHKGYRQPEEATNEEQGDHPADIYLKVDRPGVKEQAQRRARRRDDKNCDAETFDQ